MRNEVYSQFLKDVYAIAQKCVVNKSTVVANPEKYASYEMKSKYSKGTKIYLDENKTITCGSQLKEIFSKLPRDKEVSVIDGVKLTTLLPDSISESEKGKHYNIIETFMALSETALLGEVEMKNNELAFSLFVKTRTNYAQNSNDGHGGK